MVEPITNNPVSTLDEQFPGQSRKDQILAQARVRVSTGNSCWSDAYAESDLDRAFLAGDQWPQNIRDERSVDHRPMLTINRLPQFVNRVVNDMKQNRTEIKCMAVEGNAEPKYRNVGGASDYSESMVLQSIIKNIEYNSKAEAHYDRATEHCVGGSIGWLRVYPAYSDDSTFKTVLKIGGVKNPTSAMIDGSCGMPDYSDAMWGTISEKISRYEFDKRYPNKLPGDLASDADDVSWWWSQDTITVTEYFERVPCEYTLYLMDNQKTWDSRDIPEEAIEKGAGVDKKGNPTGNDFIRNAERLTVLRQRKVKGWKVIWRKITAWDILEGGEDGVELPFSTIPLVPMFGQEIALPNKKFITSLVRFARDPQREYNYWRSAAAEMVALAPKAPFVGTPENFENTSDQWDNANRKSYGKLEYTPDPANGGIPPQRQPLAFNPAAEMQQAMQADDSIKATTGIYDASLGNVSREESGRAILARERQSDIGTYHFTDSRNKAIERVGKLLVEAIPKIYTDEEIVRMRFEDDKEDYVAINTVVEGKLVNDITSAKYDVVVTSGPSYDTQRVEAVNTLIEFIQAVPQAGNVAMDIIARNMQFPGAEQLADRLKRAIPPEMLDDAEQKPPQPNPDLVLQQQIEEMKFKGKELDVAYQDSQNQNVALKIELEKAKVDQTAVRDLVAEALAEIAAGQVQ